MLENASSKVSRYENSSAGSFQIGTGSRTSLLFLRSVVSVGLGARDPRATSCGRNNR
jgi:hypothetical protein